MPMTDFQKVIQVLEIKQFPIGTARGFTYLYPTTPCWAGERLCKRLVIIFVGTHSRLSQLFLQ